MFGKKPSRNASALVTGAGSGIGRAFALELAARGGRVVCADLDLKTAQETVSLLPQGMALAVQCDVADLQAVERLADKAEQWLQGPVDLVINNAGVGIGGRRVGEIPLEDWKWAVGVNMWGVVHGCHVFAPRLRALGRGGIINVCSTASFSAAPLMGPYNLTKAAVLALSETVAAEMAGTGVRVTALCPTIVKTNIFRDGRIPEHQSRLTQKLADRIGVSAESVAKTTLDAFDRRQLYVLPQIDARAIWRMKRLMPGTYTRAAGLLQRWADRSF